MFLSSTAARPCWINLPSGRIKAALTADDGADCYAIALEDHGEVKRGDGIEVSREAIAYRCAPSLDHGRIPVSGRTIRL